MNTAVRKFCQSSRVTWGRAVTAARADHTEGPAKTSRTSTFPGRSFALFGSLAFRRGAKSLFVHAEQSGAPCAAR